MLVDNNDRRLYIYQKMLFKQRFLKIYRNIIALSKTK